MRLCPDAIKEQALTRLASMMLQPMQEEEKMLPATWLLTAQTLLELLGGEASIAHTVCTALAHYVKEVIRRLVELTCRSPPCAIDGHRRAEILFLNSVAAFGALRDTVMVATPFEESENSSQVGTRIVPQWRCLLNEAFDVSCETGLVRFMPLLTTQLWGICLHTSSLSSCT